MIFITFCDLVLWSNTEVFFVVCNTKSMWYCFIFSLLAFLIHDNTPVGNSRLTSFCLTRIILSCAKNWLWHFPLPAAATKLQHMHGHEWFLNSFPMFTSSIFNVQEENLDKYPKYFSQELNEKNLSLRSQIRSLFYAN